MVLEEAGVESGHAGSIHRLCSPGREEIAHAARQQIKAPYTFLPSLFLSKTTSKHHTHSQSYILTAIKTTVVERPKHTLVSNERLRNYHC